MARQITEVQVVGLEQLRALTRANNSYADSLEKIKATMGDSASMSGAFTSSLNTQAAAVTKNASALKSLTDENAKLKKQLQDVKAETDKTTAGFGSLLKTALEYRAISLVFHQVVQAITAAKDAMMDFDYQLSRVRRVTEGSIATPQISSGMAEEMARTGRGAKELGEAFYQLGTFIKDTDALFQAVQSTMTLVVGTEADVRDAARASIQIYNQFNGQMDKNVSQGENLRRINEAIAVTYRNTQTEVSELIQTLKYLGPIAEAAGVPVAQVFGAVGGLEAGGIRGRMAGTSMAQMITQLMKRSVGQEGGDIKVGDYIYTNVIKRTDEGGMDLIKTLEGIRNKLRELNLHGHAKEADEFALAMGGTQNAIRAIGTLNETLERMKTTAQGAADAFRGMTHVSDRLKDIMQDSLPKQMEKAWAGALAGMLTAWAKFANDVHLTGLFRDIGDRGDQIQMQHMADNELQFGTGSKKAWQELSAIRRLATGGTLSEGQLDFLVKLIGRPRLREEDAQKLMPEYERRYKDLVQNEQDAAKAAKDQQGKIYNPELGKWSPMPHMPDEKELAIGRRLRAEALEKARREAEAKARKEASELEAQARARMAEATQIGENARDAGRPITKAESDRISQLVAEAGQFSSRAAAVVKSPMGDVRMDITGSRMIRGNERYNQQLEDKADKEKEQSRSEALDQRIEMFRARFDVTKDVKDARALDFFNRMKAQYAGPAGLADLWKMDHGGSAFDELVRGLKLPGFSIGGYGDLLGDMTGRKIRGIDQRAELEKSVYGADEGQVELKKLQDEKTVLEQVVSILGSTSDAAKPFVKDLEDINLALGVWNNKQYGEMMKSSIDAARDFEQSIMDARLATEKKMEDEAKKKDEEYKSLRESTKQEVTKLGLAFYRGNISGKDAIRGLGDMIVDSAIEKQIGYVFNPLIGAITNEIAAMDALNQAVNANTKAQGGTPPPGQSDGGGGGSQGSPSFFDRNGKYVAAGLAGYSIFEQGAQHGVTVGNALGSIAAGAQIGATFGGAGALIGAGAGLLLDVVGGLFGHPDNKPQSKQPAFFNAPSDFAYYAYLARATGKVDSAVNAHIMKTNVPIVNVFVDGVRRAVRTEIASVGDSGRMALVNSHIDMHGIV